METYLISLNAEMIDAGQLPDWLPVLPIGRFTGRDNRSWTNNDPDKVIAYNRSLERDIVIDFEHSTALKAPKGEKAPASGWVSIETLEVRDNAIWARFDWNEVGRSALLKKEYKYISPAFFHDASGNVTGFHHIALTNRHNLYENPALNNQLNQPEEKTMSVIAIALGLSATASEDEQVASIKKLQADNLALNSQQGVDLSKYVPVETHSLVLKRAEKAEQTIALNAQASRDSEANTLLDDAITNGKLAPANRDDYFSLCQQEGGLEQVKSIFKNAPKIIAGDTGLDNKKPEDQRSKLDDGELAMCAQLGLTEDEFLSVK